MNVAFHRGQTGSVDQNKERERGSEEGERGGEMGRGEGERETNKN